MPSKCFLLRYQTVYSTFNQVDTDCIFVSHRMPKGDAVGGSAAQTGINDIEERKTLARKMERLA